jgi:hypothetical protein
MSYYILPKHTNASIFFDIKTQRTFPKEFISNSLIYYQTEIFEQLFRLFQCEEIGKHNQFMQNELKEGTEEQEDLAEKNSNFLRKDLDNVSPIIKTEFVKNNDLFVILQKYVNNYEFIFSKVPGTKFSVSKLKPQSIIFYELMEVASICNILDSFKNRNINIMNVSNNWMAASDFFNMVREEKNDNNIGIEFVNTTLLNFLQDYDNVVYYNRTDLLFVECNKSNNSNISTYFKNLCTIIYFIIKLQSQNGNAIIKIDNIFYKPVFDILYILTTFYEKVYLLKPNVSNVIDSGRYIICKNFIMNQEKNTDFIESLTEFVILNLKFNQDAMCQDAMCQDAMCQDAMCQDEMFPADNEENNTEIISSLIRNEMSYYFINKIEESNIVIGQQQLEALGQIIGIIKNKNREDKMETLKKNNVQKCILWCERHQIPYNKFTEKTNIFLPLFKSKNKEDCEAEESVNPYDILTLENACFINPGSVLRKNSIDESVTKDEPST